MAKVFISYSHKDKKWKDRIVNQLGVLKNELAVWDDQQIAGGNDWLPEIERALQECDVALLLISSDFLDSGFILGQEVPKLLERRKKQGIHVIPIIIRACPWTKVSWLSGIQARPEGGKPLSLFTSVAKVEAVLAALAEEVSRLANVRLSTTSTKDYMINRGPEAHRAFIERPEDPWDPTIYGNERVDDLRTKLLYGRNPLKEPIQITVTGVLFPCALLSSGWWEKHSKVKIDKVKWRDETQRWLFYGFDQWGPSWNFTWDFENSEKSKGRPYFIAQLGEGDEANSLPVLIPSEKASKLQEHIREFGEWGGIDAEVTGVLGHRSHFARHVHRGAFEVFGGLLDYCLWIDRGNRKHGIQPLTPQTLVYSGYLWRCVAPKSFIRDRRPSLHDVYFVWEHTNFASEESVAYSLDALEHKEEYLRKKLGDLVLIQKSSFLVPGEPIWKQEEIYSLILEMAGKVGDKI